MELLRRLNQQFLRNHPVEAARALEDLPSRQLAEVLQPIDPEVAALAMRHVDVADLASALSVMGSDHLERLFAALPLDTQLAVLRRLTDRESVLAALPRRESVILQRLLSYPEGSAASLMDPWSFAVSSDANVGEALKRCTRSPDHVRFYVYVVDRERKLIGVVTLGQLLRGSRAQQIASLMERNVTSVPANASRADVLENPHWRRFHALPVVDEDGGFLGVVRYETWQREMRQHDAHTRAHSNTLQTLLALGELYWTGLSEALLGGGELSQRVAPPARNEVDDNDD